MLLLHASHASAAGNTLEIIISKGASDEYSGIAFSPEILPFDPDDTISWINKDSTAHSISSGIAGHPDHSGLFFKTGSIAPAESSSVTTAGLTNFAYYYFCQIHPWMSGKLVLSNAPESLPETDNAVIIKKSYESGSGADVTGFVHKDFAKTDYQLLVYEYPDSLVDILEGTFNEDASYEETIDTEGLEGTKYVLRLVYGLPTQVATNTFEIKAQNTIPSWIKNGARWWSSGAIQDSEFASAIEHLAKENVLVLQKNDSAPKSQAIPGWLKANAGWWADGRISDSEFTNSLQYLVDAGIVRI